MAFIAAFSYGAYKWEKNFTQQLCICAKTHACALRPTSKTPLRL